MRFKLFSLAVLLSTWMTALAQPGIEPPDDPGTPVPLSGLGFLLAAGAFFGIKKLMKKEKP